MDKRLSPEHRIGLAVRQRREYLNWSQEELSFEAGLHRTYIGAVERGEKNVSVKLLYRIAKCMNTSASRLMAVAEL